MISVEEALGMVLGIVHELEEEENQLLESLGQVLAEDIIAPFDVPPYDNSAMDGYAVQSASTVGATSTEPKNMRIIGEIAAGRISSSRVEPGTAIRIMTGAPIPYGADAVVPFELTDEVGSKQKKGDNKKIGIFCYMAAESNIRRRGEDITKGGIVIKRGRVLHPAEIAVLASLGRKKVKVIRRPIIGILATGDEILDVTQPLKPGKIYNSNSYGLASQVLDSGGIPKLLGIASDDVKNLTLSLRKASGCDMLITSGGVSQGDYDVVKEVLKTEGDIHFWTVCMKPGKPIAFGALKCSNDVKLPHLGLPGNPVSSMITFEIFARPAIQKMLGRSCYSRRYVDAVIEDSIKNKDGRRIFARVILNERDGKYFAKLTGSQGSGILTSMSQADGLAVVPETVLAVDPGATIKVMVLDWDNFSSVKTARK
jgi:molybdopterin molybdotransferase